MSQIERLEAFIPPLRRFAFGLCHDSAEADDLVQDTLERALGRWHLRRYDGDLRGWLFTVLYNQFVSNRRQAARRGASTGLDELPAEPSTAAGQEQAVQIRDVLGAVARLPEDQRAVLLLIAVEELSYEEAAHILGVPAGTIMSRLSRARDRLRRMLGDEPSARLRRVK